MERFVPESFLERFVPELGRICWDVVFGTICPKGCFGSDLSWRLGAKNQPKMSPKPSFESQKPSKNDPKTIKRTKVRPEDVLLSFFCIFGRFLVAQGPAKIKPKSKKN